MRIHSPQITGSAENTNIVTITRITSLTALSASFATTASYWSGSIINAASASYWSGSIINAATASYILNAVSASYVLNAISSSYAETASSADNLTVRGTLTAQTINVQTITSSIDYVTGSSINGSLLSNTHQITGSTSITGSLTVNDSNVILSNQTSSMSVATASYWSGSIINAATASYVQNAISASYALTASYASNVPETASYALQANSASFATQATSASFALTASYIIQAQSASYWSGSIINAETASYVVTAQTASYVANAQTASYVLNAVSASFALTASYISGSGAGVGFPFSGSAVVTGSLFVSGSTISGSFKGDGSQITGLTAGGKIHTQSSAASTWTVSHNLGVQYPNVTVYNASNEVIIPQTITATDANTLTLTFGSAVAGYAVSGIGGIINVQGRTTQQYFAAATTWSFAHNLGDRYVSLQAFDDAFEMMIPTTIRLVDDTSSIMLFDSASSGYAVATIGGDLPAISSSYAGYTLQVANSAPYSASWVAVPNVTVTNAVSSSFAATASSADNLTVRGTLTAQTINVQTITSSIEFVTGSTRNGSLSSNTHEFTGSVLMTGSLTVTGSATLSNTETTLNFNPQTSLLAGYNYLNFGGGSIMYRNTTDVYIGSNAKYGSAGTVVANYTSANGMGLLTMDGGALRWQANNTSVTAGTAYAVPIRFAISGDGNVGIGTSSPSTFLHVVGANTSNRGQLSIQSNNASNAALVTFYYDTTKVGGIGSTSADFYGEAVNNYLFYAGGSERMRIDSSGLITAPYITGKSFSMTSGGGTGTAITDTGIYVSSGDWGGFGRSSTYLITFSANPNNGGSGEYSAVHVGYMSVYTGWNGSAVTTYIDYTQVASGNNIGVLTLSPRFWNGSTESSNVARGSISGNQIRIKISGYNSSHTGANQALYIQKIITSG